MSRAYYNEKDAHCAGWLRNLIAAGHIAAGDVDDRDIWDVTPADVDGYTQCHFFAGIGIWSAALRMAGWPDERRVWTGSCPCQPFSQAGAGSGFADERHVWPAWHWLIQQCQPDTIFGEQVAGGSGGSWFDVVSADLETLAYACAPVVLSSAGVGAPNIRERLYWVADASSARRQQDGRRTSRHEAADGRARRLACQSDGNHVIAGSSADSWLADSNSHRPVARRANHAQARNDLPCGSSPDGRLVDAEGRGRGEHGLFSGATGGRQDAGQPALGDEDAGGMADATGSGRDGGERCGAEARRWTGPANGVGLGDAGDTGLPDAEPSDLFGARRRGEGRATEQSGGAPDPWRELEWIDCLDGKRRPAQSGIFPLAARHPGDVAKLRAYGNAINPWVASEVIRAWARIAA